MTTNILPAQKTVSTPRWLFITLCSLFCGLYFVRDILGVYINYYIIYVVAAIILLSVTKEEAICFFIAISSFTDAGFNGTFCVMLFMCLLLRFIDSIKNVRVYTLLLIVMCLYECLHYFMSSTIEIGALVTYVMVLGSLFIVQQYPHNKINKALIVNTFIIFSLFFILVTIISMMISFGSLEALIQSGFRTDEYNEFREEGRLSANQNYLTQICSVNICLCTLMISKKYRKLPYILAIVVFIICGLLTISKMFMVVAIVYSLYVIFIALKGNVLRGLGITALVLISGVIIYYFFGDTLLQMVAKRFESEDLTTGRVRIIENLLEYMQLNPHSYVFGIGIQEVHVVLGEAIHSSFFEILGGWGVTGFIVVAAYIISLVKHARKNMRIEGCKINGYGYLPLFMLLGYTIIGMLFGLPFSVVQIMLCIYAMQVKEKNYNDVVQHNNADI